MIHNLKQVTQVTQLHKYGSILGKMVIYLHIMYPFVNEQH